MKPLKLVFLLLGVALLGYVLAQIDLLELWRRVGEVGWIGMAVVLALYVATFLTDVIGWQFTFETVQLTGRWTLRLYLVRTVGEAFNNVTPMASLGGEPVKAYLLKSHYGVGYTEAGASLVLAKTTILIALVLFLGVGFALLLWGDVLQGAYKTVAGAGLAGLTLVTAMFFLVQRLRLGSFAGTRIGRWRIGRRLARVIAALHGVDRQFHRFYAHHPVRFGASVALALANWLLGVVEVYLVMGFLGYEVGFVEAWIMEAMVQLVRAGTFFIPAALGTQEAVLLIVAGAVTGDPLAGVAFALVRRARELTWIGLGLALWWLYSVRTPVPIDPGAARAGGAAR